jgi:hypothetical protein
MREIHPSFDLFLHSFQREQLRGPVALMFAEDDVEIASTLEHNRRLGFAHQIAFLPDWVEVPDVEPCLFIRFDCLEKGILSPVNALIKAHPGAWFYYCYNAEYLHFPFCETRQIEEVLTFHMQERRSAMLTYIIDLYGVKPDVVDLSEAFFDGAGYFALDRWDAQAGQLAQQMDFFGGLKWRFEPHIPENKRRIDRIGLFEARKGLELALDHTFNIAEYNTYACPWHHSLTAAICSFRTAKALGRNPGSRASITDFMWERSTPFEWRSQQLLDLGLIEPGQWF